jgi:hypothetical protein
LADLRRELTNAHEHLARAGRSVAEAVVISQARIHRDQQPSPQDRQKSAEGTTKSLEDEEPKTVRVASSPSKTADLSKLPETFNELDVRLRALIAALNDEIQIVIGSVQIEDAKAMKRQADLTMQLTESTVCQTERSVRQTRWTVALAILAALYLPMTLVTGIYGMNIKEISGDKGPNWWWVLVTWFVIMCITVGPVGRYALVEWRWYREVADKRKVASQRYLTEDNPDEQSQKTGKPTGREAEEVGCLPITHRKRLWQKSSKESQHDGARSNV